MNRPMLSYDEVKRRLGTSQAGSPSLLLGNGFSIACDGRYSYRALRKNLDTALPAVSRGLLERLDTHNLEQVMQILEDARWVNGHFSGDRRKAGPLGRQLAEAHAETCAAMVRAIAKDHLNSPAEIDRRDETEPAPGAAQGEKSGKSEARTDHAVAFLDDFATIFTTNYDLLLYWTLMRTRDRDGDGRQRRGNARRWRDGFRRRGTERFGELDPTVDTNVFYLHGALHLFVHEGPDGPKTRKHIGRGNLRLLTIVQQIFDQNGLPLFVAAGRPEQKRETIDRNAYLSRAYDAFSNIEGDLVIFGLSLGASDQHLLDALAANPNLGSVYLSLYGDPESAGGLALRSTLARLRARAEERRGRPLEIHLFDSRSARVWG